MYCKYSYKAYSTSTDRLLTNKQQNKFFFFKVVDFCEELYDSGVRSPFLLAFLIDLYEEKRFDYETEQSEYGSLEEKVKDLCQQLITTNDVIRAKYWEYILNKFQINVNENRENNSQ